MIAKIDLRVSWKRNGSITIFLTLIFGLILALITAAFENIRILTVDAYLCSAADNAAMSVFGDYNRELYQEYGLFGYGGYGGHGVTDLTDAFLEAVSANLQTEPEKNGSGYGRIMRNPSGGYTSLYRLCDIEAVLDNVEDLTEETVFYEQMEAYLGTQIVTDLTEKIRDSCQGISDAGQGKSLEENLDMTSEYECGNYEVPETDAEKADTSPEPEASPVPSNAGGNPLETFRELLRDGVLNLVCDASDLSSESINRVYSQQKQEKNLQVDDSQELGTADLLKSLLAGQGDLFADGILDTSKNQAKLICYAQHVFPYYTKSGKQHFRYGLEYLVSGSQQEKDNLQGIISRLLVIRTVLNFAYVRSDVALQAESLATATEIAGALGLPVLITAIQQTILLILSVEESLVDITALLAGKSVPIWKNATNFLMTYPEICSVNKAIFQAKAEKYSNGGKAWRKGSLDYQQYLWLLLMMTSEKSLRLRTYDLIQDDLQVRFNATFSLEQCVSSMQYQIQYQMPFLWNGFLPKGQKHGMVGKSFSGHYQYQS